MPTCVSCGSEVEATGAPCPKCQPNRTETARINQALAKSLGGRYELKERLGKGAFGEVFKAWDSMLDREVAVKRVRLDALDDDKQRDEARRRSIREARVAAKLKHPGIVTIHDVMDSEDFCFFVMEFIEGRPLESILNEKKRLSFDETLNVLRQAGDALDCAHANNVVHRDIKPANIMVEGGGGVKVMDFGIAKTETPTNLTTAGSIVGTPNYMSPEQARGETDVDARSDLFSLGCIAYECLSGQKAFSAESLIGTLMRIVNEDPAPLDTEALAIPAGIADVLERALAKEPSERYTNASAFIQALENPPAPKPKEATVVAPPAAAAVPAAESKSQADPSTPQPVVTRRQAGQASSFDVSLQGRLELRPLAEVVRELYSKRKTGILHFKTESASKRIYFKKGNIVFANSDLGEDRLGEFMIRKGTIQREQFEQATAVMKKSGQRFGKTLVELEYLNEEQMSGLVVEQIEHIINSLFAWEEGTFAFENLDTPVEEDIVLTISTGDTILYGIRQMSSPEAVRKGLGEIDRVLRHTENPLLLYQKVSLNPSEGFVLSRVDGVSTAAELLGVSPLGEDETLKCIYGLVSAGVLELEEKTDQSSRHKPEPRKAQPVKLPEPEVVATAAEPPPRAAVPRQTGPSPEEKAMLEDIAAKHASLATATHYKLLEIPVTASEAEVKKAYYGMVKKYHPDRHHSPHMKEAHGLLEELFVKISAAYEILSDTAERVRYDGTLRQPAPPPRSAEPQPRSQQPAAGGAANTNNNNPKVMAWHQFETGRRHYDNMSYFDAIQALREAVRLDPSEGAYHKLLALSLSKNPHWRKEAEEYFHKAVSLSGPDLECFMELAQIYEHSGLSRRSYTMYQKVLELEPDNEIALEKIDARRSKKKSGLKRLSTVFGLKTG